MDVPLGMTRDLQPLPNSHPHLQRFSIGWSIATAVSEPANNILGGHCSKSIRNRLV